MNKSQSIISKRDHVWKWAAALSCVAILTYLIVGQWAITPEVLLATISGIFAIAFFLHKSKSDDARFMRELLIHFNERYDHLNNDLARICELPPTDPVSPRDRAIIVDYFNLCAEEWLFREAGYVWDPVWESWLNGMKQYAKAVVFRDTWQQERLSNSYYGFSFPADPHNAAEATP